MLVGCMRNATSGYIRTYIEWCANIVYSKQKAVEKHEGRAEIQNELVEKRRERRHGFRGEMVVRSMEVLIENRCR